LGLINGSTPTPNHEPRRYNFEPKNHKNTPVAIATPDGTSGGSSGGLEPQRTRLLRWLLRRLLRWPGTPTHEAPQVAPQVAP